ncbi:SLOG family protein [Streptomyces sp. NPDC046324]|uniref:SLOG family protein n=1 Tax=Streptomyces sp. NPDC046324 TaxID=3154915 RepID=UPI0033C87CC5
MVHSDSRDWTDRDAVREALDDIYVRTPHSRLLVVIHGACPTGADAIASAWVREQRRPWLVTEERHPAQDHPTQDFGPWPGAGLRRNGYMAGTPVREPGRPPATCPRGRARQ